MSRKVLTRRDFLKSGSAAAVGGALYLNAGAKTPAKEKPKSRVVLIRSKDALDKLGKPKGEVLVPMLDEAITALLGVKEVSAAWKKLFEPSDVVGIKSNVWRFLPTPTSLEEHMVSCLEGVGVKAKNISVGDRGVRKDPVFKRATALINIRPLRTHHWSGVGSLIKNHIMFVKEPWAYHDDTCADLGSLWKLPHMEGKTRLNVLVVLTPLFHGIGPHHYNPKYTWYYGGLLVGLDPVAVDSTGVRILLAKRKEYFKEERPISPPPKHVFLADTRHHLGTADPAKIELVKLGWKEGILI
jgi:hypothetical protein